MAYSVFLQPIDEPGFEGGWYARIPALDLCTHGTGMEGALQAARELLSLWVAEKQARGEALPNEDGALIARLEVSDAANSP